MSTDIRTHVDSPYFSDRARQSWRTLGYGGLALPFLWGLHAPGLVIAAAAAAFAVPTVWNLVASHRERNGDVLPTSALQPGKVGDRREFSTAASDGLAEAWKSKLPFDERITEAAKLSISYGRRLSVIYVRIPGLSAAMSEPLACFLKMKIRSTDEVQIISDDEFVVCAPLMRDALSADVIVNRLSNAIRKSEFSSSFEAHLGKAIYPMDGYSGADLIREARAASMALAPA
jgi:hypothetical protein